MIIRNIFTPHNIASLLFVTVLNWDEQPAIYHHQSTNAARTRMALNELPNEVSQDNSNVSLTSLNITITLTFFGMMWSIASYILLTRWKCTNTHYITTTIRHLTHTHVLLWYTCIFHKTRCIIQTTTQTPTHTGMYTIIQLITCMLENSIIAIQRHKSTMSCFVYDMWVFRRQTVLHCSYVW